MGLCCKDTGGVIDSCSSSASALSLFSSAAAQLRKVPPKKPDGEIKPYSLMEREAVRQEQKTLPWPFAPPHSPQRSVASQWSKSLSVGCSPSRAPPRVTPTSSPGCNRNQSPQSPLSDRCRARRTSSLNRSQLGFH